MTYRPEFKTEITPEYLYRELERISQELELIRTGHYDITYVEPDKPRAGDIRYADGTRWNPGSGEGLYTYNISGSWVRINRSEFSVKEYGAVGDGVTDDTTAIQSALDAATEGSVVLFPSGVYLVSSNLTRTGIDRLTLSGYGAKIYENGASLTGVFTFISCDQLNIHGFMFEATENTTYFAANTPSEERSFIYLNACEQATVRDIRGKNKRRLLTMLDCFKSTVDGYEFTGFMPDVSSGVVSSANNCPTVTFRGCDYSTCSNGRVSNHGSSFLSQLSSEHISVRGIVGEELHDNGIYLSSAFYSTVTGCTFKNVAAAGIKVRGSVNSISGNSLYNCDDAGIQITGVDVAVDSFGACGYGVSVAGNSVAGCEYGIFAGAINSKYLRDISICGNTVIDTTQAGEIGGITVYSNVGGIVCSGNTVRTCAGYMGIFIYAPSGTVTGVVCSNNYVSDVNGSISNNYGGVTIRGAADAIANGNVFSDIASSVGVRYRTVDGGAVVGNVYEGGQIVRIPTGETNVDVTVSANRGSSINVDGDNNTILTNDCPTANTYPATSTTPRARGQITFSASSSWIATGVASSADWKEIT